MPHICFLTLNLFGIFVLLLFVHNIGVGAEYYDFPGVQTTQWQRGQAQQVVSFVDYDDRDDDSDGDDDGDCEVLGGFKPTAGKDVISTDRQHGPNVYHEYSTLPPKS